MLVSRFDLYNYFIINDNVRKIFADNLLIIMYLYKLLRFHKELSFPQLYHQ